MKLYSKRVGDRISEIRVYTENTKSDNELVEKYNYCSEEFLVGDTLIKDGYDGYLGIGIFDNDFHKKNAVMYGIHTNVEYTTRGEINRFITYRVHTIRKQDVETKVNKSYTYKTKSWRSLRPTLDRFIKDLYKDGTIADFYNY